jgi:hypothetical protein
MARKPPALARELLRNFPKRRARNARRRRKGKATQGAAQPQAAVGAPQDAVAARAGEQREPVAAESNGANARNGSAAQSDAGDAASRQVA